MNKSRRPRVAAIGLSEPQLKSISPLCGELRPFESLGKYLDGYDWTETDVVVSRTFDLRDEVGKSVNLMTIGPVYFHWPDKYNYFESSNYHTVDTGIRNTERELTVPPDCPAQYKSLASGLARQLSRSQVPPHVMSTTREAQTSIIATTSEHPVALQIVLPPRPAAAEGTQGHPLALLLPEGSNIAPWFRAFLSEVHKSDPTRVPQTPPRLSYPSDWYTPEERRLANRITAIDSDIKRLINERDVLQRDLSSEGESADAGIRRAIWADGDDLVTAINLLFSELGFNVRDMDAELEKDEPKREDLRLTLDNCPGWEAIVEVKGYTNGTKTSDAQQIRLHRDRYLVEEGKSPDLTIWLSNPFRGMDPSSRPAPDQNVRDNAEVIGVVHVLTANLYQQWTLVASDMLDKDTVIQSLLTASPGLWEPFAAPHN